MFNSFQGNCFFRIFKFLDRLGKFHNSKNAEIFLDKSISFWFDFKNCFRVKHDLYWLHSFCEFRTILLFSCQLSEADDLVTTDSFTKCLLPHCYNILMMIWWYAHERCTSVYNSLCNISWTFKLWHLIIIQKSFNINCPPFFIYLFEWNHFLGSAFYLGAIPFSKCYIRPFSFFR